MRDELYIKEALFSASKKISMDSEVAKNTLLTALSSANMSTNVAFTPVVGAAILARPKFNGTNIAATTAAGVTVLAVGAINPTINRIDYLNDITNKPVELVVELSTNSGVEEVYAQNESGVKYYGYLNNGDYVINIIDNGTYKVEVVSDVGVKNSKQITISNIDKYGPTISTYSFDGSLLEITYTDEMSNIDINSAYGLVNGSKVSPISIDKSSNTVVYELNEASINVFIYDELGNESNYFIEKK
ncbi:MAG: hypothetical protein WBH68_03720 [Erysipelotrichaceae bacterium]|jgi:hypothetical protein